MTQNANAVAKARFWRLMFVLLLCALGAGGFVYTLYVAVLSALRSADWAYAQRMTGIAWPEGTSDFILISDPTFNPSWVDVHVRLPATAIPGLLSRHRFRKLPDDVEDPLNFMGGEKLFPRLYTEIPRCASLYRLEGREVEDSFYRIVLDARSGRMWITIVFG